MAFRLKVKESADKGVKRIVRRQIDNALEELARGADSDEAVHKARRRFKKIRAVLRLVRDELGEKVYRRENTCFRNAGRPLTEVRDAKALLESVDHLTRDTAGKIPAGAFARVREALKTRQQEVNRRVLKEDDSTTKVRELIERARDRLPDWTIAHKGWSAFRGGLKRVYKECCTALTAALAEATPEKLHEWRKQAKYLWHQLQLVEPAKPALLKERCDQVHELTQLLGDDHDLFVLRQTITAAPDAYAGDGTLEKLLSLIDRRREELQSKAFSRAGPLFADKPRAFTNQLRDYWKAWRSNPQAAVRT